MDKSAEALNSADKEIEPRLILSSDFTEIFPEISPEDQEILNNAEELLKVYTAMLLNQLLPGCKDSSMIKDIDLRDYERAQEIISSDQYRRMLCRNITEIKKLILRSRCSISITSETD